MRIIPEEILVAGTSANTLRKRERDLRYFEAWCRFSGHDSKLPIPKDVLMEFLWQHLMGIPDQVEKQLVTEGYKKWFGLYAPSSVDGILASLSYYHKLRDLENHCRNQHLRLFINKAKSAAVKQGIGPQSKKALSQKLLEEMLRTFGHSLVEKRDKAIILFGLQSGGRRRSEIAAARFENLDRVRGGYMYYMPSSKTDQTGKGEWRPVRGRSAIALKRWIDAAGITEGFIFRSIRWGRVFDKPVSPGYIYKMVRKRAEMCGRNPNEYGAHSLRSGFVTRCGEANVSLHQTMDMSGHKTSAVARRYHQAGAVFSSPAATVFDK